MHGWIVLGIGLAVVSACARTSMTSMTNPDWTKSDFEKVMVMLASDNLEARQLVENTFSERPEFAGIQFVPAHAIFFPGRQYDDAEMNRILSENQIDGILLISQGESGTTTATLPSSSTTRCTIWSSSQGCMQTRTSTTGGGTLQKPWTSYALALVTTASFETAWVATARSGGNAFANWTDLVNSMVDETVAKLAADGLIKPAR